MNFISRLIGCHKLIIYKFYSFLQKYLTSHQAEVTHILAYLIQSCHDLVPPEELLPVVKAIAYNFITERCRNEVITVGINSIREIFVRVPTLLKEPDMAGNIFTIALSLLNSLTNSLQILFKTSPCMVKRHTKVSWLRLTRSLI